MDSITPPAPVQTPSQDLFEILAEETHTRKEKGRLRSKTNRERKKAYITTLEQKVETLQSEIFRLQNLLISYRNEKVSSLSSNLGDFMKAQEGLKNMSCKKLMEQEVPKGEEVHRMSFYEDFMKNTWEAFGRKKEFFEDSFRMIVNNMFPRYSMKFWKDLSDEPLKDFDLMVKHSKLSKYQIPEFEAEHGFNTLDKMCSSMKPNKSQYKFLQKVLTKEYGMIKKYKEGVKSLLKAKQIFEETNSEHLLHLKFLFTSKSISDKQLLNSNVFNSYKSKDNPFDDVWGIQTEKKEFTCSLEDCPLLGVAAKRTMKKKDRTFKTEFNHYYLPGE